MTITAALRENRSCLNNDSFAARLTSYKARDVFGVLGVLWFRVTAAPIHRSNLQPFRLAPLSRQALQLHRPLVAVQQSPPSMQHI